MKTAVPRGKIDGLRYVWKCSCPRPRKPCSWCFDGNLLLIKESLATSRGQTYYGNLKAYLAIEGEAIALKARAVIEATGTFTPGNLLEITDEYLCRSRTKPICEWLEECGILPLGTYERLKARGFRPMANLE